jgi:hypothetical protein
MPKIKIDAIWREGSHLDDVKEGIRTLRWLISNTQSGKTIWHLMREVEMGHRTVSGLLSPTLPQRSSIMAPSLMMGS